MSTPSPYLDGFLAAARPTGGSAGAALPAGLSFEERTKHRLHPLDSFARLLECASANRPPDAEDRFRFQWFGLFYQAPAQDAFTLRVRLPGGRLRPFQLAGLADITQRFGSGQIVLNARGGLDVPGVPVRSAVETLCEVESIGLSARRTGGDCVQAVRGGEFDGDSPEENCAPLYALTCALEHAVTCGPAFADLPGPCEIVLQATRSAAPGDSAADALVLRQIGDGAGAFVLLLPGEPAGGLLLALDAVVPACSSLLKSWASGADRSNRERAGIAEFLRGFDADAFAVGAGWVSLPSMSGLVPSGMNTGTAVRGGRLLSGQMVALEQCCRERGWREVRLANGCLHAVSSGGKWLEATAALEDALSV